MIKTEDVNKELQIISDQLEKVKNTDNANLLQVLQLQTIFLVVKILRDIKINQTMIMRQMNVPMTKPNNKNQGRYINEKK
jgi:hypothetical protein